MWNFKVLIFVVIINLCWSATDDGWKWYCKQNLCLREHQKGEGEGIYPSIEICRLVCGDKGAFWPIPTKFNRSSTFTKIHPSRFEFTIHAGTVITSRIKEVALIFQNNLMNECPKDCPLNDAPFVKVDVTIDSNSLDLSWTTDESYTINHKNSTWVINAPTFYGARHAIETLSQLTAPHPDGSLVMIESAYVYDKPYYPHRSLLLDTSRNFLTTTAIKRQIDAMAASKLNILHWHITDSQSFPFQSTRVPQFHQTGAYDPVETYSRADFDDLVTYAILRGVRILPELDAPAHAGFGWQWGPAAGLGELAVCVNAQPWRSFCIEAPCGQLNPANPHVYDVLEMLYDDLTENLLQKDLFHMGGDEIFLPCWNSSSEIVEYLHAQGKGQTKADFLDLWGEFQAKALARYDKMVGHNHSTIMLWSSELTMPEVIEKYLDKQRYVVETWVPSTDPLPNDLLSKGYRLIISTKNAWYLDHGFWGVTKYYSWRTVYNNKLIAHKNVLGGEVCMWSEYLSEEALDGRVWPRAAAAAERMWSNPTMSSYEAESRMYRHRERLAARGIQAEALTPFWCYQNEGQCT